MPEVLFLLVGLALAGALVLLPLHAGRIEPQLDEERAALETRHRVALEALRDVGTDHVAGSLDDDAYAAQRAQAEERAAQTRAALDAHQPVPLASKESRGRGVALAAAGLLGASLLAGALVPATGIGNHAVVNQGLADAQSAEAARQDRITELLSTLAADPENPETLSDLADAYLAGSSSEDLVRGAVALRLLVELEPERADAYERIMSAYLRAGDYVNARAAHDSYADLDEADPVEVAFFDGLIALRGEQDPARATAAFDQFLELAPDDPRAGMIRGLRDSSE
jgi:cytochrome c-type biogenesis protein CcmH/NrfG